MTFSKKILTISLIIIVLGALAYFLFLNKQPESETGDNEQVEPGQSRDLEEEALPVKVMPVIKGDLIIRLSCPGEAVTNMNVTVEAEVSGVVKKIHVRESQHVSRGDLVLEIDDKEKALDLESSEAAYWQAFADYYEYKRYSEAENQASPVDERKKQQVEENYKKAQALYEKGLITKDEFTDIRRQFELMMIESGEMKEKIISAIKGLSQAEVKLDKAKWELRKTKIKAPFSGIVYNIKVSPQEHVKNGSEIFSLVNIRHIQVNAKVLESEIKKIKVGREVDLKFSAYPSKIFHGVIRAVSPVVNPEDKTCQVIIDVDNPKEEIKPGMHAEVNIEADIYKDKVLIPQDAVLVRAGRKLSFVVEGDRAKWRYLELGLENEEFAEVVSGVKEGESAIVEGHFTLAHDAKVKVEK